MAEIKLIALDLDGTLLDSQKRLSSRNKEALLKCMDQGIWIVPCTGRIWSAVPDFLREMNGIRYAITTNGAVVEDVRENKILDERKMPWELAVEIFELAQQFHTMYDVYVGGRAFGELRFAERLTEFGMLPLLQDMVRRTRKFIPDVSAKIRELGEPVEKINYFFGDMQERERARAALKARGDVIVTSSFSNNLEINARGATKGEGLLRLAAKLGVKPEETMGFGDNGNDATMMQMAGVGVAMGNAEEDIKNLADYVTDTNDADGVAQALERLIWNR